MQRPTRWTLVAADLELAAILVVAIPVCRILWCLIVVRPVRRHWALRLLMAGASGVTQGRVVATAFLLKGSLRFGAGVGATVRPMSVAVALALAARSMCRLRCVGVLLRLVVLLLVAKTGLTDQWSATVSGAANVIRRVASRR